MSGIICCVCASPEWCACSPGTEAEERLQGNICLLYPAADIPLVAWCAGCWPHRNRVAAPGAVL